MNYLFFKGLFIYIEISSPELTPIVWTNRMPMILKFASLWLSPSPPYGIRKNFPEGATASCRPLTPASVSGWGGYHIQITTGWRSFDPISKKLHYSKHKNFCHNIQTLSRRPVSLPSLERESLEDRADGQRKETGYTVSLASYAKQKHQSLYGSCQFPPL